MKYKPIENTRDSIFEHLFGMVKKRRGVNALFALENLTKGYASTEKVIKIGLASEAD